MVKFANTFGIEVYELLKPPNILPDKVNNVIAKYTEDVFTAIEGVQNYYLTRLNDNAPYAQELLMKGGAADNKT
jgi:hypothetical protein